MFIEFEPSEVSVRIGNCLDIIDRLIEEGVMVDAIVTDPPYEINYMDKAWDATGTVFQPETWAKLASVLKPGGYIAAFSAARVYHHLAAAIEQSGIESYPFLIWTYQTGLPKPMNVAKLFDRDNCPDREPIGSKKGSGYNTAQIRYGVQNYSKLDFPTYEENVSEEAKKWSGYYYGVNTLKPAFDPIYLGRKPIATDRTIDNIRTHGTGALNVGALRDRRGSYPTNVFAHAKTRSGEHGTSHPTVKPTSLMEELVALVCPTGGIVLDPFCGTGTTGIACQRLGMKGLLIDIDTEMEQIIHRRLRE